MRNAVGIEMNGAVAINAAIFTSSVVPLFLPAIHE